MTVPEFCPACEKKLPALDGSNFCPYCGYMLTPAPQAEQQPEADGPRHEPAAPTPPDEPEPSEENSPGVPWEDRPELTILERLTRTWSGVLLNPVQFYHNMTRKDSIWPALLYGFIFRMGGWIFSAFWARSQFEEMPDDYDQLPEIFQQLYRYLAENPDAIDPTKQIVLAPLFIVFLMLIIPALFQVSLMMFGWAKENFSTTFRITAYADSAAIFQAIPVIGGMVHMFWWFVVSAIGLREKHSISTAQAILAMLLPLLACCGVLLAFLSFIIIAAV